MACSITHHKSNTFSSRELLSFPLDLLNYRINPTGFRLTCYKNNHTYEIFIIPAGLFDNSIIV